jgi:N-acetylmuramic acid 6-phosphate etherase
LNHCGQAVSKAIEKAKKFLNEENAFRLGELLTESSHPKTRNLSQAIQADIAAGIRLLQSVDEDIPPVIERVLQQDVWRDLVQAFVDAVSAGRRIFFTGCGATGRLSILLEAAWRRFWQELGQKQVPMRAKTREIENAVVSVMAGGDFALIKSVEGFEDFPQFGQAQLKQAGVQKGDVVVAITEGGETPFVIGTAWQGLEAGAKVFFVYNNPTDLLCRHVQRSRRIIEEPRIRTLELATGPMAITGSTRMQAVTTELLVVGSALEVAAVKIQDLFQTKPRNSRSKRALRSATDYYQSFVELLSQLSSASVVDVMARVVEFEENAYRRGGLVTYMTDSYILDVLTDTTERSPTFTVPAFRKFDDERSPPSWAFVKNPFVASEQAWQDMLGREPRGLDWGASVYEQLEAPPVWRVKPPQLGNSEIYKFRIGNEPDASRTDAPDSALVIICVGAQIEPQMGKVPTKFGPEYHKTAAMVIGPASVDLGADALFHFRCDLPDSPLQLWQRLAVKLIFNTISTATMVRMGRVIGNAMVWLSPSNKKLIDRGSRLISQQTECSYEQACIALHQAIEEVDLRAGQGQEVPSPVALAIENILSKKNGYA